MKRICLSLLAGWVMAASPAMAGSVRQVGGSGATDTAGAGDFGNTIAWTSTANTAKTESIPGCGANIPGAFLTIVEESGSGGAYGITVTPTTGSINGAASAVPITAIHQTVTLQCDSNGGVANWITVQTGGAPISPTSYAPITIQTINSGSNDLKHYTPNTSATDASMDGTLVTALGYYVAGDGGAGIFYWTHGATGFTDDGGSVIVPPSGYGAWQLQYQGQPVSAKQWGANGNATLITSPSGLKNARFCQSGGGIDNAPYFQNAVNFLGSKGGGELRIPAGVYRTGTSIFLPLPPVANQIDLLGQDIKIVGAGPTGTEICYDILPTGQLQTYAIDAMGAPSNLTVPPQSGTGFTDGVRAFITLKDFSIVGAYGATSGKPSPVTGGGIRLFDPGKADIDRVHVYGFPQGDGVTLEAGLMGGDEYNVVENSFFGWQEAADNAFTQGRSDATWLQRGVVIIGNEDNNSKGNENLVIGSAFWNCKLACIAFTGYDQNYNPGVPAPTGTGTGQQNGVPAGASEDTVIRDSMYAQPARQIDIGTALSTSSSTTLVCTTSVTSPATLVADGQLTVSLTGGQGAGQIGIVTAYSNSGGTGTINISGAWDTTPNATTTFVLGYRMDGIYWDGQHSFNAFALYTENLAQPVHLTANASSDINLHGGETVNSNGAYVVSDAQLTGTVASGSTSTTIVFPSTGFSLLDGFYNGRLVQTVIPSVGTVTRQIGSYVGSTHTATLDSTAYPWGGMGSAATPMTGNAFTILGGPWPSSITGGLTRGLADPRPGGYTFPAEWYVPAHVIQNNPASIYQESTTDSLFVNQVTSPAFVTQGYVGRIGTGKSLKQNNATNEILPIVVAGGLPSTHYLSGQMVPIARSGSEAIVSAATTINVGDTLVADFTNPGNAVTGATTVTDPKLILGYALGACTCTVATPGTILARIK